MARAHVQALAPATGAAAPAGLTGAKGGPSPWEKNHEGALATIKGAAAGEAACFRHYNAAVGQGGLFEASNVVRHAAIKAALQKKSFATGKQKIS